MSWLQLYSIAREAKAYKDWYENNPPVACPHDGEPLLIGPTGERFCKFDGWRWNGSNAFDY